MGKNRDFSKFPNAITVLDNGNVGIGVTNPAQALDISRGSSTACYVSTTTGTSYLLVGTDSTGMPRIFTDANPITLWTSSTERLRITSTGNIGINTTNIVEGTQAAGSISIIPVSSVSNGPLIQFSGNGRIRPADGQDRLSIDGNSLWLNSFIGGNILMNTAGGNVGIGTNNPLARLHVYQNGTGTYSILRINNDNSTANFHIGVGGSAVPNANLQNNAFLWNVGNSAMVFGANDTERMRITASGNVGIGTTSPSDKLDVIGVLRVVMPNDPLSGAVTAKIVSFSPSPFGLIFRGYETGTHSIQSQREANNAQVYGLSFQPLGGNVGIGTTSPSRLLHLNSAGDTYIRVDSYSGSLQTLFGTDDLGTYIGQQTNNIVRIITNSTERMRIHSNGNVSIGTTLNSYRLQVAKTSIAAPALMISGGFFGGPRIQTYGLDADPNAWMGLGTDMAGNAYEHSLYYSTNGRQTIGSYDGTTYTTRFYILANGNYWFSGSNLSDVRLKENIQPITLTASEKIALLNPCSYNMKDDLSVTKYGFVAQEVQSILPDLIRGGSDKNEDYMGLDYDGIFTVTVKAVQEILVRLKALEEK